ncbi:UNVERIFIED_CONTAM: hypothetical protein PYX00_011507 [Menopon gallinae]|uniref:Choline transporter-like protein n=1 Tax=Menopon gallinae TaxID=328185 RepID=A0AAW2H7U8_9NEOP
MVKGRKFHDAWAFFLYAIATSAMYSVVFALGDSVSLRGLMINYRLATAALGYLAAVVLATVLFFRFCPKLTLHFSFLGGNILNLYFILHFRKTYAIVYGALWGALSLLFYFVYGYRYIAFTSVILRDSARTFVAYFLHFVLVELAAVALLVINCVAIFLFTALVQKVAYARLLQILLVLNYFWTESNMLYALSVFASSVAGIHVLSLGKPRGTLGRSFRNTFFALGSICLGGLIIAVIKTLQHVTDRTRNERRFLIFSIFQIVCMLFLYFLVDIARTINDWAYLYLAIHGTSFRDSVVSSFEIAMQRTGAAIMTSSCINMTIFFAVATGFLGSCVVATAVLSTMPEAYFLSLENVASLSTASIVFLVIFMFSFIYNFAELFSALSKSIMFLYVENPRAVREDVEKFTIENVNKISLTLLENAHLRDKHLDNFLVFILKAFKDEAECLAKLKVMDTRKMNRAEDTRAQIVATVLSIKGVRLGGDIESAAIVLTSRYTQRIFSKLIRWYFGGARASRQLARDICSEVFRIKRIACIKGTESSSDSGDARGGALHDAPGDSEGSTELQYSEGDDDGGAVWEDNAAGDADNGDGLFVKKKKGVEDGVAVQRLLKLLKVIVDRSKSDIRDFYHITTLLRMQGKTAKEVVNAYIKNLGNCDDLESCFLDGLRISPKMIFIFPQVYRKVQNFSWQEFIDVIKERPRLDVGCLSSVKMPPETLGQILHELRMGEDIVKSQIRKMDLRELLELELPRNRRTDAAVKSRIDNLRRQHGDEAENT